jgi:hypothetical protein
VIGERLSIGVIDIKCDVCDESVVIVKDDEKFMEHVELRADFGYAAKAPDTDYHIDLCEDCFHVARRALRDHRNMLTIFDVNKADEDFGLQS